MLAAMRPDDSRYASVPVESGVAVDASVRCVGMLWPVINPLSRYRNALTQRASDNPPDWIGTIPEKHDVYWGDEAAMEEGNPLLALVRGEDMNLPPAVWIQGRPDPVHDYRDPVYYGDDNEPERFISLYRSAGGDIDIVNADPGATDDLKIIGFFKDFGGHLGCRADRQPVIFADDFRKFLGVLAKIGTEIDLQPFVFENRNRGVG